MSEKMTYAGVGVNYAAMDPFKRMCQLAGLETAGNMSAGLKEFEASRGESAYLIEADDHFLAHVEEGLGTKNLVADAMYALTGKSYYDQIAQDTVAMIVNDMITVGAMPLSVAMHLAAGSSEWFEDEARVRDLINGWRKACDIAFCAWGGGETPTLRDIILPGTVVLAGSAIGIVKPKEQLITCKIQEGDAIIFVESSGIHANGLTAARKIADKLKDGYLTQLSDGRTYGETLLDPTRIYVQLVADCLNWGVDIHYAVNITGHGWRKLMRAVKPFTYVIERLPAQRPIFDFIQEHGPMDDKEAYGNLNMGAGFALYVTQDQVEAVIVFAQLLGLRAFVAGHVESGPKQVIIKPRNLVYEGETLAVR